MKNILYTYIILNYIILIIIIITWLPGFSTDFKIGSPVSIPVPVFFLFFYFLFFYTPTNL